MTYNIFHETVIDYQSPVTFSHNIVRLQPKSNAFQTLDSFELSIEPKPSESEGYLDMFGNMNHHLLLREPHMSLAVTGRSTVQLNPETLSAHIGRLRDTAATYADARKRLAVNVREDVGAKQFLFASENVPVGSERFRDYALESFQPKRSLFEAAEELMGRIFDDFAFVPGFSDLSTPVETVFEAKKGVCQDFAHFAISALRGIGIPACYVSGYIETVPPEGEAKLFGADASHAWVSLYMPGSGWLDLDPTNNIIPVDQHIVLGHGRDYHDISPLKGVVRSSGGSRLRVRVDVRKPQDEASTETSGKQMQQQQRQIQEQW